MIRAIIEFSLRQRLLIIALTLLLAGLGVYAFISLPIDAFPDLTNNQVNVITDAPGMAAAEIEQLVTYPIESAMLGIRGAEGCVQSRSSGFRSSPLFSPTTWTR